MTYTQEIVLDVSCLARYKYIHAKQDDNATRFLKVTLMENGEQLMPASGDTAYFRAIKPDRTGIYNPATINQDGTITVELTQQTLAVKGIVAADVMLMNGDAILGSGTFFIQVEACPLGDASVESSNEFIVLQDLIANVEEIIEQVTGGYYIPSFTADGKLHLEPSKDDMPELADVTVVTFTDSNDDGNVVITLG